MKERIKFLKYQLGHNPFLSKVKRLGYQIELERLKFIEGRKTRKFIRFFQNPKRPRVRYRYRKIKDGRQRLKFENNILTEIVTERNKKKKKVILT